MKKLISTVLALVMVLASMVGMFAFPAGAATETNSTWPVTNDSTPDIYEISSAEDLKAFATKLANGDTFEGKTIALTSDISLNVGWDGTDSFDKIVPSDVSWVWPYVETTFAGNFDGRGFTISGIYYSALNYEETSGLFGFTKSVDVTIKDFTIARSYFQAGWEAATTALVYAHDGEGKLTIDRVHVASDVTYNANRSPSAFYVGMAYTRNGSVEITNCVFSGTVAHQYSAVADNKNPCAAAFVGYTEKPVTIKNCAMYGTISNVDSTKGEWCAGIISEAANNVTISDVIVAGNIQAYGEGSTKSAKYILGSVKSGYTVTVKNSIVAGDAKFDSAGATISDCSAVSMTDIMGSNAQSKLDEVGIINFVASDGLPVLANEITIGTAEKFKVFVRSLSEGEDFAGITVNLTADIDLNPNWDGTDADKANATYKWPTLDETKHNFHGTFNGNEHTISGIYRETSDDYTGIFGAVDKTKVSGTLDVVIKDFTIAKSYFKISGAGASGLITIYHGEDPFSLTIENVHVSENVLFECSNQGAFYLGWYGWGKPATVTIKNCIFSGTCRQTTSGKGMAVFLGSGGKYDKDYTNNITVDSCAIYGTVAGDGDSISGIADDVRVKNTFTVKNCIVAGSVSANSKGNINYICRSIQGAYEAENNIIVHDSTKGGVALESQQGALTGLAAQDFLDEKGITDIVATTTSYPVFRNTETNNTVEDAVTKYCGYQVNASSNKLRLIGLADIASGELANYDAVGFKVVGYYMEDGSRVNAFETRKTTVYTSIKAGNETWTSTGINAGNYIFVQEITGINATKPLLLEITTFHVAGEATVNGNTTTVVLNPAS